MTSRRAMVLAAGLGLRLRPITDNRPKPLVAVGGRTMLDRALDHLAAAGVRRAVVNCHYLGEQIERHLSARADPKITLLREDTLLDTGGGVANALTELGSDAFFVVNADIVWTDGPESALNRLAAAWRDDTMDALLLVQPLAAATGYAGRGDFELDVSGRLHRQPREVSESLVFTGVQMLHPRLFGAAPDGPFSLNLLYDHAEDAGRLYGVVHDGEWYHVGTPEALAQADAMLGQALPGDGSTQL